MEFIDIPTEQTTAFTDLLLFILSLWAAYRIWTSAKPDSRQKAVIWSWVFILLSIAALFGAFAHGFKMSKETNLMLWQPLNLALGLSVSLFAAGAILDLRRGKMPKKVIYGLLALGLIFYFVTVVIPGSFLVFIIYEAVVMLFALSVYFILSTSGRLTGGWWMTAGILISIVAAVIQASGSVFLSLIWEFDYNGIFHLVQMVGIIVLLKGLLMDIR